MPPPFFQATIAKSPQSNCRRHKTTLRKQVSRKRISLCRSQQQKMCALDSWSAGLDSLHRPEIITQGLIPASGNQDHTISLVRRGISRRATPPRPSHPALNVRDDRDTPLLRAGCADITTIFGKTEELFSMTKLNCSNALHAHAKSAHWRKRRSVVRR